VYSLVEVFKQLFMGVEVSRNVGELG